MVLTTWASAQSIGSSIRGTVVANAGGPLEGVEVQARCVSTGGVHVLKTDASGRYLFAVLAPGDYEVRFALTGFRPVTRRDVKLEVGQHAVVDPILDVGWFEEELVVEATHSPINLVSGALSGWVGDEEIRDLPLNGRSFQQLALLRPGVSAALSAGNEVIGGRTPKMSINGARPDHNCFLLDGTDIDNVYNKAPGSVAGVLLGVDAVREFQVLTNAYSAEFGKAAGGVVNVVTRSGGNVFTGSLFGFYRNSALDARNFFDAEAKPRFTRHQFGATLGGPIVRDRTFFFLAVEGLVERLGITGVTAVPDADARQGILPGKTVVVNPAVEPYLDALFPMPNGRSLGGGVGEYLFTRTQPTNESFYQARVDHRFSSTDTVFARYTYDHADVDRQSINRPPLAVSAERSRNHYFTLEHQHVFSPRLLNTLRLGFNRSVSLAENVRTATIPDSLSFVPGEPFGFISISGVVTELGGDFRLPRNDRLNVYQVGDVLHWSRGRHALSLGFQGLYLDFDQESVSQRGGVVTFASLESFLLGRPVRMDASLPGLVDPFRRYRQSYWAFFVQDDVRIGSRLSANVGLRYEFVTVPSEVDGKVSNLRRLTDSELTVGDPWFRNPSLRNLAPRLGLAWDPWGTGKTAVRAGIGLFYDEVLPKYYYFAGSVNPPYTTRISIPNPPFPEVLAGFDPHARVNAQVHTLDYDLESPQMLQFNLTVQRSLGRDLDVSVGYVGSRGDNLMRVGEANLAPEAMVDGEKVYQPQLGRRNPAFVSIFHRTTDARSFYNALQLGIVKRHAHGWRFELAYTYGRSVDDASGVNSQDFDNGAQYSLDWYEPARDRGLSAFHVKHNLTFNWTLDLPFARQSKGVTAALFKGWQLSNITTVRSGMPFTVRMGFNRSGNLNTSSVGANERPDLKPGYSTNPVLGGPDRYWDIEAFQLPPAGRRGNLGRNTLIGPGLVAVDLALTKSFGLGKDRALQLRVECFNVPNHPNFSNPSGKTAFTTAAGDVAPDWGRITSTVTTSRQFQLAARLVF